LGSEFHGLLDAGAEQKLHSIEGETKRTLPGA
jgi:hypothetical protein